jgi:hypothetical protein
MATVNAFPTFDRRPHRTPWRNDLAPVSLHCDVKALKGHALYHAAKSGDFDAAVQLVAECMNPQVVRELKADVDRHNPVLCCVHAVETFGVNQIPRAMQQRFAELTGWEVDDAIAQTNVVAHTGEKNGFARLSRQALFFGPPSSEGNYVLLDDFIGQGGTFANLRGYIEQGKGTVLAASALTGRRESAMLQLSEPTLNRLKEAHVKPLESIFIDAIGFTFDCCTESEGRFIADAIDKLRKGDARPGEVAERFRVRILEGAAQSGASQL